METRGCQPTGSRRPADSSSLRPVVLEILVDVGEVGARAADVEALPDGGHRSRLILQVHDEVLLEVDPREHELMTELTETTLSGAAELRVPLEVNLAFGDSWAAAKT